MPLMNDLLEKLQDAPPSTEQELRDILQETGYDLVMVEPTLDEPQEMMEEELALEESEEPVAVEEAEYPEDMGPEDEAVEVDIIEEVMPADSPMSMMQPGMTPRMMMHLKTRKAAKKALKEG